MPRKLLCVGHGAANLDFPEGDPLTAGTITVTPGDQQNALSATAATGGTGDKTYQWYGSTTEGFTPGPGNELSGFTSLNETDTGLTNGVEKFYRLIATDGDSDSVTYDEVSGTPSENTALFSDDFSSGDTTHSENGFSWNNTGFDVIEYETGKWALKFEYNPASTRQLAAAASASATEIVVGNEPHHHARFILGVGTANEEAHFVLNGSSSNITDNGDGTWTVTLGDGSGNATSLANSHADNSDYQYNPRSHPSGDDTDELRFTCPAQQTAWFRIRFRIPDGTESWGGEAYAHRDADGSDNNKWWKLYDVDGSSYNIHALLEANPQGSPNISKGRPMWGTNSAKGGRASSNWDDLGGQGGGMITESDRGTEITLDFQIKVSDTGSSNGIWRGWKDGSLWIEDTGIANDPIDGTSNEWLGGYLAGWANSGYLEHTIILVTLFEWFDVDPGFGS